MDDSWLWKMFLFAYLGSFFGLIWPVLVALYKKHQLHIYKWISPEDRAPFGGKRGELSKFWWVVNEYVIPVLSFLVLALIISGVTAALGFFGFLEDEARRESLKKLGTLAYFSSFGFGFATASFVEEPLKR